MYNQYIQIKGAKVNNLKNIDVNIPRNKLVVITGLSGSGKSSLAFDTLYAEGQRRYVESLSSYARQFMGKITKPEVELIKGIPPAIAIEQKIVSRNPRSTVGTSTEIYEYLKLLFAKIGKTYSPIDGKEVKREDIQDVLDYLQKFPSNVKVYILSPLIVTAERTIQQQLEILKMQGFSRIVHKKEVIDIDHLLDSKKSLKSSEFYILIDRFKSETASEHLQRIADSVQTAFYEGKGACIIQTEQEEKIIRRHFSYLFEKDGIKFEIPSPHLFSFNNPYGACKVCQGTGIITDIDPNLVIPDTQRSVYDDAVVCWRGESMQSYKFSFIEQAVKEGFPIHRSIENLSVEEYDMLWNGRKGTNITGINAFFNVMRAEPNKIAYRVILSRFMGRITCPTCHGTRIRPDANYIKINGKSISDMVLEPIGKLCAFFQKFKYSSPQEKTIAQQIVSEIMHRLKFLTDVGVGYLTLNRESKTLSGGESQRIYLATSLGSSLVGSLYILDEPSIGLHARDTLNLIKVLQHLRDIGNTVIIVEHDAEIIRHADYIIDIGPGAGRLGGEVVFTGDINQLLIANGSLTAEYMRGLERYSTIASDCRDVACQISTKTIPVPEKRRKWRNYIEIFDAKIHNLKNIHVKIPLDVLTVITGVSGSGKSTLIKEVLFPKMMYHFTWKNELPMTEESQFLCTKSALTEVILVDQNPIGKSSRSNPATYLKVYDDIRELFAQQPLSKQRNYKAGFFSFNVPGGRCETCQGEGVIHVEMQFMADVDILCNECNGARYKDEVLDVKIEGITISDILNMTVNQAKEFFEKIPASRLTQAILFKLQPLLEVGLGYLKMGQSSSSLSGGEAQRVKLAYYLCHGNSKGEHLFIFDEPTTGLHFHDINKLYHSFNRLIDIGNSIIVIEHHPDLIKCADWIIDIGPEGGEKGGEIVFEGTPEDIVKCKRSLTGKYLYLERIQ